MRLLVLGGSFNPVHIGHLLMVEEARAEFGYDLALLVPSLRPPHKDVSDEPGAEHRARMLRLAVGDDEALGIDLCEFERGGTSYTIDTLRDLHSRFPVEGKVGLLIGDDLVPGFPAWRKPQELADEADIICAHRLSDAELPMPFPHVYARNTVVRVSSSMVRERIAARQPFRRLVDPKVYDYIIENGLYGLR